MAVADCAVAFEAAGVKGKAVVEVAATVAVAAW